MPDIVVILGLPAAIAIMAVTFVVTLGAVGEVPRVVEPQPSQIGETPR